MRSPRSRFFLALTVAGLLSLTTPAQAGGYHNPGQYYGPPPQPYQAHAWSGNPYAPAAPSVGRDGGATYHQPYYPSQPNYSTGGFRPATVNTNYTSSGVYRVIY